MWHKSFLNFLDEITHHLQLTNSEIQDITGLSHREIYLYPQKLTLRHFKSISNYFDLDIETIISGAVDIPSLKENFFRPGEDSLPEKFLVNGGSYMSSIRSLLDFIKIKFNEETATNLRRSHQIGLNALTNDSLQVNADLINSILHEITYRYNFNKTDLDEMAKFSYTKLPRGKLLKIGKSLKSDIDVLNMMVKHSNEYELTYEYSIIVRDINQYILRGVGREEQYENYSRYEISTPETISYKASNIRMITDLMGKDPINITHINRYVKNKNHHVDFYIKGSSINSKLGHIQ